MYSVIHQDEEFRENGPDEGLRLGLGQGLRRVDGPSNGWGQKNTHDETGGGGEGRGGRGGNTIPSPEAGALAAAARGGGEYVTGAGGGGGGGGDWRQGTTQRGVAPVPAPAPPGWGGSVPGAGAAAAGAAAGGAAKAKSVVLGIPTVPRPQGVNYLDQTLQALLAQVEHVSHGAPDGTDHIGSPHDLRGGAGEEGRRKLVYEYNRCLDGLGRVWYGVGSSSFRAVLCSCPSRAVGLNLGRELTRRELHTACVTRCGRPMIGSLLKCMSALYQLQQHNLV